MSFAASASEPNDPVLALLQPLFDRLDSQHVADGRCVLELLSGFRAGNDVDSDDPRIAAHLPAMRQAYARENAARPGVLFQNWSDLHNHLRFALVPAGRALLDLHSEAAIAQPSMDALMLAVGLTAILQQAPQRFRSSAVVWLPAQWFPSGADMGVWLGGRRRNPALDTAYGNGLTRLAELLLAAERGRKAVHNSGLARGMDATAFLLHRMQKRLQNRTPNVRPVNITLLDRWLLRLRR